MSEIEAAHAQPSIAAAPAASAAPVAPVRLAYLLSRYPAVSHTFFLQEVTGLRRLGFEIETASINAPDRPPHDLPEAEKAAAASTFYVKGAGKPAVLGQSILLALTHPVVALRGLRTVLALPNLPVKRRLLWLAYLAEALLVGAWMRHRKLPHLHVHFGGPVASVGMLVSAAWGVPYSLTIHGPEELQDVSAHHLLAKLHQAKFVLCISDFAKSQLMQRLAPGDWAKLEVVRLGVAGDLLNRAPGRRTPAPRHAENRTPHLLCVGRLVPEKGQRLLLEVLRRLRAGGILCHLTLAGAGPERASLEALARAHGLSDQITFLGATSHPQTLALLEQADIFVLPSFAEGIPVALMEAMALELPCVSTTVAGISELIRHGQDGLLVAPSNIADLSSALRLLIGDPELRQRLGAAGRRRVLEHYDLGKNHLLLADTMRQHLSTSLLTEVRA